MASECIFAAMTKPPKNSAAEIHRQVRALVFGASIPPAMQPMQKRIITIVNVSDSCALVQSGYSCAIGMDSTLQA